MWDPGVFFRYDSIMMLSEVYKLGGISPELTANGNKLYEMRIPRKEGICPEISFKDTYNWIPMRLGDMPKSLGLTGVSDKPFFPYRYNQNCNLHVELPHLPDDHYYNKDAMSKKKKEEFEEWHTANYNTPFLLKDQLLSYCMNDVEICAEAIVKFDRLMFGKTGDSLILNSHHPSSVPETLPGQASAPRPGGHHTR